MALHEEFEKQGNWLFRYRSFIPLIILLIGAVLYVQTELNPAYFFLKRTSYELYLELSALSVSLIGLLIRIYTVGHTPKNTSGRNTREGQVADSLNTTGIYSIVRHPLYLGNFLMWLGPAMLTGNFWFIIAFCLFYWIYYERIMYAEEQFLIKKFGNEYIEWSEKVPAFIPKCRSFVKPELPFCWKKVLRKEKNGLFALFLIFCFFDVLGEVVKTKPVDFNDFFMTMCFLTGLNYVVIKLLKTKTSLLEEANR